MKTVLSGAKFSSNHQTYIPYVESLLTSLKEDKDVKKVMLGEINPVRPGKEKIRLRSQQGNLYTLHCRGVSAVQIIRVVGLTGFNILKYLSN